MPQTLRDTLILLFAVLSRESARKKLYSLKAGQEGRQDVGRLLRAISNSEKVQARRILNSVRGRIDASQSYLETVFEKEIADIVSRYSEALNEAKKEENKALITALSQLRTAERKIVSFYSKESHDVTVNKENRYFVCQFCGYIHLDEAPVSCPVCGADQDAFRETE